MWKQDIEITVVPMLHLIHTALGKAKAMKEKQPTMAADLDAAATSVLSALVIVLRSPQAAIPAAMEPYINFMVEAVKDVPSIQPVLNEYSNEAAPAAG